MPLKTKSQRDHINKHIILFWVHEAKLNRKRLARTLRISEAELRLILTNPSESIRPRQVLMLCALLNKPLNVMLGVIYAGLNSVDAVSYMKGEVLPEVPKFDISEEGKPFGQ